MRASNDPIRRDSRTETNLNRHRNIRETFESSFQTPCHYDGISQVDVSREARCLVGTETGAGEVGTLAELASVLAWQVLRVPRSRRSIYGIDNLNLWTLIGRESAHLMLSVYVLPFCAGFAQLCMCTAVLRARLAEVGKDGNIENVVRRAGHGGEYTLTRREHPEMLTAANAPRGG